MKRSIFKINPTYLDACFPQALTPKNIKRQTRRSTKAVILSDLASQLHLHLGLQQHSYMQFPTHKPQQKSTREFSTQHSFGSAQNENIIINVVKRAIKSNKSTNAISFELLNFLNCFWEEK